MFEVEHFRPKSWKEFKKLRAVYANLLWACRLCNATKDDQWPSQEEEALGYRMLDPASDTLSDHVREGDDHGLEHVTRAGEYFIETLDLNSRLHRSRRARRPAQAVLAELRQELIAKAAVLPNLQTLERIAALTTTMVQGVPHDVPVECLCTAKRGHLRVV